MLFRSEDLFYRLGVVQINLPNVSERKEDIKLLVDYFIDFYNSNMNIKIDGIDPEAMDCFFKYDWPGNIRELRNAVETAYNNVSSSKITIEDIPERISRFSGNGLSSSLARTSKSLKNSIDEYEKSIIINELNNANGIIAEAARRLGVSKQLLKYKINKYELK